MSGGITRTLTVTMTTIEQQVDLEDGDPPWQRLRAA